MPISKKNPLRDVLKTQIKSQRAGFLIGAGSSFLGGEGYPLAFNLWRSIKEYVEEGLRSDIQSKLDAEAIGIERALDLLDTGMHVEARHRYAVAEAVATHFATLAPDLTHHRAFVNLLASLSSRKVTIFSLNYDPLIERAAEQEHIRLFDGFHGHEAAYFDPTIFGQDIKAVQTGAKGLRGQNIPTWLELIKLHGSLGWYACPASGIRRTGFDRKISDPRKRLMIPPQHRKAQDTGNPPYAGLWTEFRGRLVHGPILLNRLVCVGYGMADEHVNAVIEQAMARDNFTLIIVTKGLSDEAFERWSRYQNAIIVTEDRSYNLGKHEAGDAALSTFEGLITELSS
ncbi:MAG: SIR2 family protein [Magnetovibrionaceae bacterium]